MELGKSKMVEDLKWEYCKVCRYTVGNCVCQKGKKKKEKKK